MSRDSLLVFGAPLLQDEDIEEVIACLRSGWIGTGPRVARFEEMFREYKGSREAVALSSCTAALHLALVGLELGPGDEVLLPALTFVATANAVTHAGATPVFVDVDRVTQNVTAAAIEAAIGPRTRAVIVVHFAGRPCEMDAIVEVCQRRRLRLIEDCAHAIETEYHGRRAGTFGDVGCFSFYATKNVTTGEGGMLVTDDERLAARVRQLALHGMSKDAWKRFSDKRHVHYDVVEAGFKYNMMDLQAAMAIHQLPRIDAYWSRRCEIWERYREALADLPLGLPAPEEPQTRHARHLFTLIVDAARCGTSRDALLDGMIDRKIGVGVHYRALHLHPYYCERSSPRPGSLPNAEWISERTASIPLSPKLTDADVADVIEAVRSTLGE